MHRILFFIPLHHIGLPDLPIYSYGVMLMAGFLAAIMMVIRLGRRDGLTPDDVYSISMLGIVSGVIGARLFWILFFWPQHTPYALVDMVAVWNGGLVFYGGLIFGTGAAIFYIRKRRLPVGRVADAFAPGIAVGLAFGRIGCFLNGCCYGAACRPDAWYGVVFPPHSFTAQHHAALSLIEPGTASLPVYPAQLFATAAGMVLAIILLLFYRYRRFPGQVMLLFAMLYSLVRFVLEMIRDDTPNYFQASWGDGLNAGQIVSIFVFALSAGIMLYFSRHYGANQRKQS